MNLLDSLIFLCLGVLAIPALIAGLVIIVTGIVRFFLAVFKISPVWGVILLFLPLLIPVFIFMNWKKVNGPVWNVLGGMGLLLLAGALFGGA